jgi:hypothetical protein
MNKGGTNDDDFYYDDKGDGGGSYPRSNQTSPTSSSLTGKAKSSASTSWKGGACGVTTVISAMTCNCQKNVSCAI